MDLFKIKKIYMIGVKGVGMAMLAQFFAGSVKGIEIIGSDVEEKFMTDEPLKKAGVKIKKGFDADNIPADADLIIYSTAYNAENNSEVRAALNPPYTPLNKGDKKVFTYAEVVGEVFNQKYGIAVVGSHGKTTTTAWLAFVLNMAGKRPSAMVGASVPQFGGAALVGGSDYLIVEADEYQNKLKYLNPKAVLLNNIDYDHPDFFPTTEDYEKVFIEFIKRIPKSGFLVANWDDTIIRKIANVNCHGKVVSYAINEKADYVAYDIKSAPFNKGGIGGIGAGKQYFKVKLGADDSEKSPFTPFNERGQNLLGDFSIQLAGKHNISNALAVIAACVELSVELVDIRRYLEDFTGTARRMETMGEWRGATIIDDYAHHPTEIRATLAGARELYGERKIKVVFHPHTFTRTKALLDDFAKSFKDADEVVVLDIYGSAREEQGGVHSADLVRKLEAKSEKLKVCYIPTLEKCEEYLRKNIERGDVVILMGAGDVFRIGEGLMKDER